MRLKRGKSQYKKSYFELLGAVILRGKKYSIKLQIISPQDMQYLVDSDKKKNKEVYGFPNYICAQDQVIRFYPIPDKNYTAEIIATEVIKL